MTKGDKMPEPKIDMTKKKDIPAELPSSQLPSEQPSGTLTPEQQYYWNWVRNVKLLEVSDLAVFKVEKGYIFVPTDAIGRPLLDSSLHFSLAGTALKRMKDSLEAISESDRQEL